MSNTLLLFTPERMNPSVRSRFQNWRRFAVWHGISFSGVAPVYSQTTFLPARRIALSGSLSEQRVWPPVCLAVRLSQPVLYQNENS